MSHVLDLDAERKAYEGLRAECALRGYSMSRSDPADGPPVFWVARWGMARELKSLAEAGAFVRQIGGTAA